MATFTLAHIRRMDQAFITLQQTSRIIQVLEFEANNNDTEILNEIMKEKAVYLKLDNIELNRNKPLDIELYWKEEITKAYEWVLIHLPLPFPHLLKPIEDFQYDNDLSQIVNSIPNILKLPPMISEVGFTRLLMDGKVLGLTIEEVHQGYSTIDTIGTHYFIFNTMLLILCM